MNSEILIESSVKEIWLPLTGWSGFYEVSNLGAIRSVRRLSQVNAINPERKRMMGGNVRKLQKIKDGYLGLWVTAEGRREHIRVHRAVLLAFKGEPKSGQVARHLNGKPDDNRAENLEWGSHLENMADRKSHGNYMACDKHVMAKLTPDQVEFIRASEMTGAAISRILGIGQSQISRIRRGQSWRAAA